MSNYTVLKVFAEGEILTAADLNGVAVNDILNGPINHASQHASGGVDDIKAYFLSLSAGGTVAAAVTFSAASSITLATKINENKGSDIIAAATTDIGAAGGNFVDVTGNITITALGTVQAGTRRIVRFTGTPTLTHNGTSLILPGAANIVAAANDIATFLSLGTGNWVCESYQRAVNPPYVQSPIPAASTVPVSGSNSKLATGFMNLAPGLAMTGEVSAENVGIITTTAAGVEVVAINLGNVTADDRIWVFMLIKHTKGATAGHTIFSLGKKSGTATAVRVNNWALGATDTFYQAASTTDISLSCNTIVKIAGTGTLELALTILSIGSDGSIAANNGELYAFFLRKQ